MNMLVPFEWLSLLLVAGLGLAVWIVVRHRLGKVRLALNYGTPFRSMNDADRYIADLLGFAELPPIFRYELWNKGPSDLFLIRHPLVFARGSVLVAFLGSIMLFAAIELFKIPNVIASSFGSVIAVIGIQTILASLNGAGSQFGATTVDDPSSEQTPPAAVQQPAPINSPAYQFEHARTAATVQEWRSLVYAQSDVQKED